MCIETITEKSELINQDLMSKIEELEIDLRENLRTNALLSVDNTLIAAQKYFVFMRENTDDFGNGHQIIYEKSIELAKELRALIMILAKKRD